MDGKLPCLSSFLIGKLHFSQAHSLDTVCNYQWQTKLSIYLQTNADENLHPVIVDQPGSE